MYQGLGKETDILNRGFGFNLAEIDHMILSHAHIDHCGLIPKLIKDGYNGNVYAIPGTKDLAEILMAESAFIQENDLKFENKTRPAQGKPSIVLTPLYDREDAEAATKGFVTVDYGKWFTIDEQVQLMYLDAGHLIGSATVHLKITENGKETALTFSGDFGRYRDIILRSP